MSKGTSIKEALSKWEEKNGMKASESSEVKLCALLPPIEKMDASLSTISGCQKLSLSTNCIEKIANLNGLSEWISFNYFLLMPVNNEISQLLSTEC